MFIGFSIMKATDDLSKSGFGGKKDVDGRMERVHD